MCVKLVIFVVFVFFLDVKGETIFRCTGERNSRQTISLQCPYGKVIKVVEAIYGRNQWQQCMYTVGDCTEKVDLDADCCGRSVCNITVWRIYSIKCQYVTFFRVIHECVEVDESECKIHDELENEETEDEEEEDEDTVTSLKFPVTSSKNENSPEGNKNDLSNGLHSGPVRPLKSNTKGDEEDEDTVTSLKFPVTSSKNENSPEGNKKDVSNGLHSGPVRPLKSNTKGDEEDEDTVTSLKFPVTSSKNENNSPEGNKKDLSNGLHSGPVRPLKSNTKGEDNDYKYLVIILGSAVAVAFLLAAIIIVLFLLRRFKWNGEKECILQMFAGLCKRYPPDGCESPERDQQSPENPGKNSEPPSQRFNINNKHLDIEKPDIGKVMHTKLCNINAENVRNERKLEHQQELAENTEKSTKKVMDSKIDPPPDNSNWNGSIGDDAHAYRVNIGKGARDAENNYVEFDKIVGERYSNPVLRKMTPKRVVIDSSKADVTYTISEEPGTTAV